MENENYFYAATFILQIAVKVNSNYQFGGIMHRECYHVYSDHHNEFFKSMRDVKSAIIDWQNHGESHIKVYRLDSDDSGSDEININEDVLNFDDMIEI